MNGSHFLESLKELGYTKTKGFKPQSFDWIFENEAVLPFLEWFCNCVSASNILTQKELDDYTAIERAGQVLDGRQLDDALKSLETEEGENLPSEEELREEIENLEQEIARSKKWKEQLIRQRNLLSVHQTSLGHRLTQVNKLETKAKQELSRERQRTQSNNDSFNNCLKNLTLSVSELSELYYKSAAESTDRKSADNTTFLSQLDLDEYYKKEAKFTSELTKFTKKQFFEGIAEMAGQNEGRRYDVLEIRDPDSLLIKGENEKVNMADCKELARLQAIYPKSESQRINAVIEEQRMSALCNYTEDQCHMLRSHPYPCEVGELSQRLHEKQKVVSNLKREVSTLGESHIPELLNESAASQANRILRGDYDLKIARQDYFTSNQDRVIDQLIIQRSRYEFLTMAYEIEARNHRDTHRLLTAVSLELKKTLKALENREEMMKQNPGHASHKHQRGTIDSRDNFMINLHKILDDPTSQTDSRQLFLTYTSLQEAADVLNTQVTNSRSSVASMSTMKDENMVQLEKQLQLYEKVLYSGSSTSKGLPRLSPPQLVDVMTRLDTMLTKLQQAVKDIITDVDQKKKLLRSDPLQAMERNLFVHFMNDPEKLRQTLANVSSRLEAYRVSRK